jgi:alpha-tubulin suppressor-like RCC1 family protein
MKKIITLMLVFISAQIFGQCFVQLNSCGNNSIALKEDGSLWTWGDLTSGTPTQVGTATDWIKIGAGEEHFLAVKSNGTLWTWGNNYFGELGDGTIISRSLPAQIGTETDWGSVSSGGYAFSIVIKTNGTLWAWGRNEYGQLGDGTFGDRLTPVQIGSDTNWQFVAQGGFNCVAKKTNGTLWSWGRNNVGQLGFPTSTSINTPTQIGTATNWNKISAGTGHVMAIKSDGTLWTWGYNASGQLGIGSTDDSLPIQVGTATNWKNCVGGTQHSAAIKTDGSLYAWGRNGEGQLGDGTWVDKNVPTHIGTATNWSTIVTGAFFTAALNVYDDLYSWGYNAYGQLGNGTVTNVNVPTAIPCPISLETPLFTPIPPICTLTTTSPLPTTSLNGITGTWSPTFTNATPPYTITTTTYTFTPNPGQNATTTTMDIQVYPLQDILFMPIDPICSGDVLIPPTNTSLNGITGTWSPSFNNTTTTTYTFTPDAGYCAVPRTLTITVNPVTPTFTAVTPICTGDVLVALPTTSTNGITGTWSPALNNSVTTTYTFTPDVGSLCAISTTLTIVVNPIVTPIFEPIEPFCVWDYWVLWPVFENTSLNGITGTWSPALDFWYPTSGTYTFTPNPGQCATTTTLDLVINPWVFTTFTPVAPICSGETLAPLPTTSLEGITGTWTPTLNNTATTTYTFSPDTGQCAIGTTMEIIVKTTPIPIVNNLLVTIDGPCYGGSGVYNFSSYASFVNSFSSWLFLRYSGSSWILGTPLTSLAGSSYFESTIVPIGIYPPTSGWVASPPSVDEGCAPGTLTIDLLPMNTTFCEGATVSDLAAIGTNIKWYDVASGGRPLETTTLLATGTYYVTQTISGCESIRELVTIIVNPIVTPTFTPVSTTICYGAHLAPLPTTSLEGITGTWTPALNNTTTTTYLFIPDPDQCVTPDPITLTVVVMPVELWYADADSDGFGDPLTSVYDCTMPSGFVTNNSDCNDANPLVNPLAVEICFDGIDNNCNGVTDEGCTPIVTGLTTTYCGTTLSTINQFIYAASVPGFQAYRFEVVKMIAGVPSTLLIDTQYKENPFFPQLCLTNLPYYDFDTSYQIRVAVKLAGVWHPYGSPCIVTTPKVYTQIRSSQCDSSITSMGTTIYANIVAYAPPSTFYPYLFKVTNTTTSAFQIIPRQLREFRMNLFPSSFLTSGTIYTVEVAVRKFDGTYMPYGPVCTITTPTLGSSFTKNETVNNEVSNFNLVSYPNPFETDFKLDIQSVSNDNIQIKVYDMLGKLVEFKVVNAEEISTVTFGSNYPSGVYNVIVSQGEYYANTRVIKR